jgi:hypothetical protein
MIATTVDRQPQHRWRRVWLSGQMQFSPDYDGYFPRLDPARFAGPVPDYAHLDGLDHIRGLVLLGDPGMGKSTELVAEHARLRRVYGDQAVLWADVQADRSIDEILDQGWGDRLRQRLANRRGRTFALIDAIDGEMDGAIRGVQRLARLLADLPRADRHRLHLRLTCRRTDWTESMTSDLQACFERDERHDNVSFWVYSLGPLTRADIVLAADERGLEGERFADEVGRVRAQGLVERPITLRFLLEQRLRGARLSTGLVPLYRDGLMRLCAETDDLRENDARDDAPADDELLECAEHLAAVFTFTGGVAWAREGSSGERPVTTSTVGDLRRAVTFREGGARDIDARLIRATLRCALFTRPRRGTDRVDFAHRTYAEFLAARCLLTRGLETEDALRLLRDPCDPQGRVPARLLGVAGWYAAMHTGAREQLQTLEPQAILRAGSALYPEAADRVRLVGQLLDGVERGTLTEEPYDAPLYGGLAHPEIEEQLASYLGNPSVSDAVWRVARSIATACRVPLPARELARIACDPEVAAPRRAFAATLVADGGDDEAKEALRAVLDDERAPDGVFGIALRVLWPGRLGLGELLPVLRPPRDESRADRYHTFLNESLLRDLRLEDAPTLLQHLGRRSDLMASQALRQVALRLLRVAWENAHLPEQADAFARVLAAGLVGVVEKDERLALAPLIDDQLVQDVSAGWPGVVRQISRHTEPRCREILDRVLALLSAWTPPLAENTVERLLDILVLADAPLARRDDRAWIVERCGVVDVAHRATWRRLAGRLEEMEPILAATLALRQRTSLASRFLDESHLEAIRLRPWVQRVHAWREGPAQARPSVEPTPGAGTAASAFAATQPEGPTLDKQRAAFEGLRRNVQLALSRARLPIRGSSDLLDAVTRSLQRLDGELSGSTPQAFTLWNERKGECWPKLEEDLSDVVAKHLSRDLGRIAVVSREPQIGRGDGYLDLLVEIPGAAPDAGARVVIEVKGSWNRKLDTAMETQLVDRYLRPAGARFGLYLVGWFSSPFWEGDDSRRPAPGTLEETRQHLLAQARVLSERNGMRVVAVTLDCRLDRLRSV